MTAENQTKAYPKDFHDYESFFKNVHADDLVFGQVTGYNSDKDTGESIGAFVTLIERSPNQKSLSGLIRKQHAISSETDSIQEVLPIGGQMTFRVQRIDQDNQRISLSLPSFKLGDKGFRTAKPQPKFEQTEFDYNDPVDNSGVTLDSSEKAICVQFPAPYLDGGSKNPSLSYLATSIRILESENKHFKAVLNTANPNESNEGTNQDVTIQKAQKIVDNCLAQGYTSTVYVRNLAFSSTENSRPAPIFAFRLNRTAGDWLDLAANLPLTKTLLLVGRGADRGNVFCVQHISVISNSEEVLPFEVKVDIVNYADTKKIQKPFIFGLLGQMVSITRHTNHRIVQYEEYLDWQEKITNLQIKGCKYVGVNVNRDTMQLEFHLIFKNKEEFEEQKRYLRRSELKAYSNEISSEKFSFKYSEPDLKTAFQIPSTEIREAKGIVQQSYLGKGDKSINIPEDVYGQILRYNPNPYIVTYAFEMEEEDIDLLTRQSQFMSSINEKQDEHQVDAVEEAIQTKILPKYMFDKDGGFLALSAVGEQSLIRRHKNAIKALKNGDSQNPHLAEWLFDVTKVRLPDASKAEPITQWVNPDIAKNQNQREAIEKMVNAEDLFLLQGPPGTGKTTFIDEAIVQFVKRGKNVLLASQSNDAVDNAMERLAMDPSIRSVRISNRRSRFGIYADDNKTLSEDNCLENHYKSISKKISEDYLDKWQQDGNQLHSCNNDLRNLELKADSVKHFSGLLQNARNNLNDLAAQRDSVQNSISTAIKENKDARATLDNHEKFLKFLDGKDEDFFLFDSQLTIAEDNFWSLNDSDFNLATNYNRESLNDLERSKYMKIFVNKVNFLVKMLEEVKSASTRKTVQEDQEIQTLKAEIATLNTRLENTADEAEFSELHAQIGPLQFKLSKLTRGKNSAEYTLNDVQKDILSPRLQDLLKADAKAFIPELERKISQITAVLDAIRSQLAQYVQTLQFVDEKALHGQLASIQGKISSTQKEIQFYERAIQQEQKSIGKIAQKYSADANTDFDTLKSVITRHISSVQQRINNSQTERNMFGDLLTGFKQKLDESISNELQMKAENDLYKDEYIKSCNVVGISCNTDPRILGRNDFDVVIIDEVSKATPPELLITMLKARTVILVGDHRQLPPLFKTNQNSYEEMVQEIQSSEDYSQEEKDLISMENFRKFRNMVTASFFKEMFSKAPAEIKASLWTEYRFHKDIMDIVNCFYDNRLQCGIKDEDMETAKAHGLTIPSLNGTEFIKPERHAYWIDSTYAPNGEFFLDSRQENSTSICNYLEMAISINLLKKINAAYSEMGYGIHNRMKVSIISFYQMQVTKLRRKIRKLNLQALEVTVNTVDRFQGQQKGIIIVNMIRNVPVDGNGNARISKHMVAYERINVAFSRPENMLVIVGAKNAFEAMDVPLPSINDDGVVVTKVYRKILNQLHLRNSIFESKCLVSPDEMVTIKEEMKKDGCQSASTKRNSGVRPKFNHRGSFR